MIALLSLIIFLSVTPAGHSICTVIRDETNSFLGLDIVSIELASELKTDEGVFPAVYTFKAYGVMKNGNITDDIRWRILSEDGSEGAEGVSVLASPEYGTISITAEYPGNFVIEASCMNVNYPVLLANCASRRWGFRFQHRLLPGFIEALEV